MKVPMAEQDAAADSREDREGEQAGETIEEGRREADLPQAVTLPDIGHLDAVTRHGADIVEEHADVIELETFAKSEAQVLAMKQEVPLVGSERDTERGRAKTAKSIEGIDCPAGGDNLMPPELMDHIADYQRGNKQFCRRSECPEKSRPRRYGRRRSVPRAFLLIDHDISARSSLLEPYFVVHVSPEAAR